MSAPGTTGWLEVNTATPVKLQFYIRVTNQFAYITDQLVEVEVCTKEYSVPQELTTLTYIYPQTLIAPIWSHYDPVLYASLVTHPTLECTKTYTLEYVENGASYSQNTIDLSLSVGSGTVRVSNLNTMKRSLLFKVSN